MDEWAAMRRAARRARRALEQPADELQLFEYAEAAPLPRVRPAPLHVRLFRWLLGVR